MRFIVSTSALLKHLQAISGALSSNTVLPILENFLFEIHDGSLTISATDLQTSMSTNLQVEAKDSGKIAIPSRILIDTLKTLPEQPVTFTINNENHVIEISAGEGKYKLAGEEGDDFPKIPVIENAASINLPADVLNNAITKTLFAVSGDELRPNMTGVLCQMSGEDIVFVATDAHKLVRYTRKDISSGTESSFIIPKKALTLLKNTLPDDESSVSIDYNESNAFFRFGELQLICRLIDEKYPDYEAVIPANNPNKLTLDRAQFLSCLKRVVIYSNKTTHQVRLRISGSELNISSEDPDFSNEAHERLTCQYEGEDMEIGFNARFLIDMLATLDSEEVVVEMSTPNRAGLIIPTDQDEHEDVLMLVMPVMLNSY